MKINTNIAKTKWFEFDDGVEMLLRHFPLTHGVFKLSMENDLIEQNWELFDYCVQDWKGFEDEKDNELECNNEMKRVVFDNFPEVVLFVLQNVGDMQNEIIAQKKI